MRRPDPAFERATSTNSANFGPNDRGAQVGLEVAPERGRVDEREVLGLLLEEEVERIDDRHVGDEVDLEHQLGRVLRKDEARLVVAERILLPVEEVRLRLDAQRVRDDRRAAVRRGAQANDVRRGADRPVVAVASRMVQRDADAQGGLTLSDPALPCRFKTALAPGPLRFAPRNFGRFSRSRRVPSLHLTRATLAQDRAPGLFWGGLRTRRRPRTWDGPGRLLGHRPPIENGHPPSVAERSRRWSRVRRVTGPLSSTSTHKRAHVADEASVASMQRVICRVDRCGQREGRVCRVDRCGHR